MEHKLHVPAVHREGVTALEHHNEQDGERGHDEGLARRVVLHLFALNEAAYRVKYQQEERKGLNDQEVRPDVKEVRAAGNVEALVLGCY